MKKEWMIGIWMLLSIACSAPADTGPVEEVQETQQSVKLTRDQLANAGIRTGKTEKRVLHVELKLNGTVDVPPQNIVSVGFPLGGYLKSTKLLPGMHIRKGEVIAVMEDQALIQLQQDYLVAKSKLEYLEKEYLRQKELNENQVSAAKVLQQATADFESQKVLLKAYSEKLALIGIRAENLKAENISRSVQVHSPIDGFVSKVNVNVGRYVLPSEVLFELINPSDIHAALTVYEKDLNKLQIGQNVIISMADDPGKNYQAEIYLVSRNVDENRSATVHCHFVQQPKQLLPGMFLNGTVQITTKELACLPETAVVRFANKEFIFLSKGSNDFEMKEIQTGIRENGMVEIKEGENLENQTLVTENAYSLLGKMKNKIED